MSASKVAEEFPNLRLGDLFRLSVFVSDNMLGPVPTSMRSSMKGSGSSHKRMMRTLDAVEQSAQELIVYRVLLNPDGTHSDRIISSYSEAVRLDKERDKGVEGAMGTKRLPGAVTPYARIWYLYGTIVGDLFTKVAEATTPSAMQFELERAIAALKLEDVLSGPYQRDEEALPDSRP